MGRNKKYIKQKKVLKGRNEKKIVNNTSPQTFI